jgi:probable HAF family extracellular repeat protein
LFELAFAFLFVPALLVVKLPLPRRFKAWLVALVSLTAVAVVSIAPMMRPRAQSSITTYTFTDLGKLGTGTLIRARGINDCGTVVGESNSVPTGELRPFIWRDGVMKDVAPGASSGTAAAINSSGFVTGTVNAVAFIWHDDNGDGNPDPSERFSLGALPPDDAYSDGFDINDAQQVVGVSRSGGDNLEERAFLWQQGVMQAIPTANGITPIWGTGINNAGHIVGPGSPAAYLRKGSSTIDLKTLGGSSSFARDVNEDVDGTEYVVGLSRIAASGGYHAFIWHDDDNDGMTDGCEPLTPGCEMKDLGTLGGPNSQAFGINANRLIVGSSDISAGGEHAFVYDTTMHDLNSSSVTLDLPPGWVLMRANAINGGGQIVGYGTTPGGETHAFLLTPTPGFIPPQCQSALPTVNVSVSPSAITEDAVGSLTYTFTRSIVTASPLTVNFSVGGNADAGDYTQTGASFTPPPGTVTFAGGSATAIVTVDPVTDSSAEPNETVELTLTADAAYTIGSSSSATGTINNDDTNVSVSVSPSVSPVLEDGSTNLVYTFTRTGLTNAITVNFSLTGSTATLDTDYMQSGASSFTSSGGTINFGSGETVKQITVAPKTDTFDEPDETVILTITSGTGYTAGSPSAATGIIADDDGPPTISINNVSKAEGNSGQSTFDFIVSLSNASSSNVTVNYQTAAGTTNPAMGGNGCVAGTDFLTTSGLLSFTAGETSKQVSVPVCGDNDVEADETFFVNLSVNSSNSNLPANTKGTGTITNDDLPNVSVAVSPLSTTEDGATNLVYTFTRNSTIGSLTVNFSVGGTADPGTDYAPTGASFTPPNGTVAFANGSAIATVTVNPNTDTTVESDETVILTLTAGAAYTVGTPSSATGTITNDDTLPTVTVGVSPVSTAEDGSQNLVYTFTRIGVTTAALTVNFSVAGTATLNTDYSQSGATTFSASAGTVTLPAGDSSTTVTVNPTPDSAVESDETVILTITPGAAYTVGSPSSATGTITNDDVAMTVQLGQSTFTVSEDSQVATITVTRIGDTSSAATVKYSTSDIAGLQSCTLANTLASERCDYTTAVGRVTFAPGETSKTFTVPIVNDVWVEGNETFFVNLSNPVGASLGSQATSTVEINDNDFATPTSNPIFGVEYFIRALYRDILNRQPDSQGLQNWIDTLTPCPNGGFGEPPTSNCDRLHIAAGFFQSDEYLNRGYWAFRFYMVSFNQRPTYAQFIPDLSEVGGPKSPAEEETAKVAYAEAFVQRPSFIALYGGLSGQALADALTQKTGLPPFTVNGETNGQILRKVAERQTSLDKFLTEGTVSILYFGFQRRDPDAVGYQNNVDTLNANPNNLRHMIFIFIYSTEYLNRFGPQ